MSKPRVLLTDHSYSSLQLLESNLVPAGAELIAAQCKTPEDVIAAGRDMDVLLVTWAPITAAVIAALTRCKLIIRLGIGYDNVDLVAAKARGIPVCNVPDYGVREVAEHAVALALALVRQLPEIDRRLRGGTWKITPDRPMLALHASTFATAGFGRIARAAHEVMRSFGCQRIAYDPYVTAEAMTAAGVEKVELDQLFARADILSLHLPITPETKHLVSAARLAQMKKTAYVVNTARGPLIDMVALAAALRAGTIAGAGLDVYEQEPVEKNHPLFACPTAILTSHVAWYSESSIPKLQQLAAEETVRGLKNQPLKNQVNK